MKCPFCNEELEEDSKFCPFCGNQVESKAEVQDENKTVAAGTGYTTYNPGYQNAGQPNGGYQNQGYQNQPNSGYQNGYNQSGDEFGPYKGSGKTGGNGGLRNLLLLLIVVCALIVGGLIGFIVIGSKGSSEAETTEESVESVEDNSQDEAEADEAEADEAKKAEEEEKAKAEAEAKAEEEARAKAEEEARIKAEAEAKVKAEEEAKAKAEEEARAKAEAEAASKVPVYSPAAVSGVSASTYLSEPQYNLVHDASKLCDGDISTAWVEGVSGQGIGEFITITLDGTYLVSGLRIYNGHQYSSDIYYKNSRPSSITITCSNGTSFDVDLSDTLGQQEVTFSSPQEINSATITINGVYPGSKYEDTCISEMGLY